MNRSFAKTSDEEMSKRLKADRLERIAKDIEKWIRIKQNNIIFGRIIKTKEKCKKKNITTMLQKKQLSKTKNERIISKKDVKSIGTFLIVPK